MPRRFSTVLLDAMGVLYRAGDDVEELLVPFVQARNPSATTQDIARIYLSASLGEITAEALWKQLGLDPDVEDEYLEGHLLQDGLLDFLCWAEANGIQVCCLSNDVSEWSAKLRRRFSLDERFSKWVISGDVGIRKPDIGIYERFLSESGLEAADVMFVDDRKKNVQAALSLGFGGVLFGASHEKEDSLTVCASFDELRSHCIRP